MNNLIIGEKLHLPTRDGKGTRHDRQPADHRDCQRIDAMDAYLNLMAENPHLQEKKFEKIFCYHVDETVKENGGTVN
jgi:hypothetical protein